MVEENKNWKPHFRDWVGCGLRRDIWGKHLDDMREKLLRLYYYLGIIGCIYCIQK